jgi:hypothetical protein
LTPLSFAAGHWLWLLPIAVLGPLVIHWLSQRQPAVVFPAAALLVGRPQARPRRSRLRRWLLLVLRVVVLGVIVLAFAQPQWSTAAGEPAGDPPAHWVLLVDRSASMQREEGGQSLFQRARGQAVDKLKRLAGTAPRVSVILIEHEPSPLLPEPTRNVPALIDRLQSITVSDQPGRLAAALNRVEPLHQQLPAPQQTPLKIALYTDAQKTHWPRQTVSRLRKKVAAWQVHKVTGPTANTAVTNLAIRPTQPVAGQRSAVTATVRRFAGQAGPVTVELTGEGLSAKPERRKLRIGPNGQATARWSVRWPEAGSYRLRVALAGNADALAGDDAMGWAVNVAEAQPVALLTRDRPADAKSAAFFVSRALQPIEAGKGSGLEVASLSPSDWARQRSAAAGDKGRLPIIVIVAAGGLNQRTGEAIQAHLKAGGGVVWWLDSEASVATYNRWAQRWQQPNRARWPRARWAPSQAAPMTLGLGRFDAEPLAVFQGAARAGLLSATFSRYARLSHPEQGPPLLASKEGEAVMRQLMAGEGRVILAGLDLAPASTGFGRTPWFLPLMHELVRAVTPTPARPESPHPGEGLPWSVRSDQHVLGPGEGRLSAPGGRATARAVGWHRLMASNGRERKRLWVRWPASESDLTPATPKQRQANAASAGATRERGLGAVSGPANQVKGSGWRPLWPALAMAALLLLAVEPMVAAWRRSAEPGGGGR